MKVSQKISIYMFSVALAYFLLKYLIIFSIYMATGSHGVSAHQNTLLPKGNTKDRGHFWPVCLLNLYTP